MTRLELIRFGQREREYGSAAELAGNGNGPTLSARDGLGYGQSHS